MKSDYLFYKVSQYNTIAGPRDGKLKTSMGTGPAFCFYHIILVVNPIFKVLTEGAAL